MASKDGVQTAYGCNVGRTWTSALLAKGQTMLLSEALSTSFPAF